MDWGLARLENYSTVATVAVPCWGWLCPSQTPAFPVGLQPPELLEAGGRLGMGGLGGGAPERIFMSYYRLANSIMSYYR